MAVIRHKVNRAAVPAWVPVNTQPKKSSLPIWRVIANRLLRILNGDPEQMLLAHKMEQQIDKTRTDIYIKTGGQWF